MSMAKILEVLNSGIPAAERYVALYIANHFNDKTKECYPSAVTIAREAGLGERTVRRALAALVKAGHISRNFHAGLESSYQIHPKSTLADPCQNGTTTPAKMTGGPLPNWPATPAKLATPIKQTLKQSPTRVSPVGASPSKPTDQRHHEITSQIGRVYEAATGSPFAFNGRFASVLKRFLTGWKGTSDEWLDRYEDCLRLSKNQFAGKCRSACDPCNLCQNWLAVCAEIESFDNPATRKSNGFKNTI